MGSSSSRGRRWIGALLGAWIGALLGALLGTVTQ
jgi:hypothetical protein